MATNSRTNRRPPVAKPLADTAPRKKALKNNENHAPQASTAGALDELEQKYNIEGCNTLDIVHARIENDAAQEKLVKQAAHLESSEKRNTDLQRQVAELQARLDAGNGASEPADDAEAQAGQNNSALEQENTALKAQLAAALAKGSNGTAATEEEWISRPRGTAGTHFSIKTAMKLDRSAADEEAYKCLLRNVRDLALNARINWELPWKQIPVDQKASLFEVARTRHPYLAKFENDWATEELVKQFIKNRRNRAYKNNWIPVPAQYQYLKANAAKRDPHAPRGKQRKLAKVGAAAKAASKKKAVTAKSRNVAPAKAKRTARKRRATDSDEDEDMEEPVASGNGASADEEEDNDE